MTTQPGEPLCSHSPTEPDRIIQENRTLTTIWDGLSSVHLWGSFSLTKSEKDKVWKHPYMASSPCLLSLVHSYWLGENKVLVGIRHIFFSYPSFLEQIQMLYVLELSPGLAFQWPLILMLLPPELLTSGKIPPESTLTFNIEVMEIRNGPRSHESFQEMDLNDDWKLSKDEVKEYLRKEFQRHGYPPNDTHHEQMVEDIFKKEDENEDGFISSREFTYKHDEL